MKSIDKYKPLKEKYPDVVFLFNEGDVYSSYNEDADIVNNVLGIPINEGSIKYVSFARGELGENLRSLILAGNRVAIADPIESEEEYEQLKSKRISRINSLR